MTFDKMGQTGVSLVVNLGTNSDVLRCANRITGGTLKVVQNVSFEVHLGIRSDVLRCANRITGGTIEGRSKRIIEGEFGYQF